MGKGKEDSACVSGMAELLEADLEQWLSGWALTHDYDPTWDYQVRFDLRHHRLALLAQSVAHRLVLEHQLPWEEARVYPADLEGPLAVFASGTNGAPVIVIDLDAHQRIIQEMGEGTQELDRSVAHSVVHELRHAYQEAHDWPMDEDEAEYGSHRIPF